MYISETASVHLGLSQVRGTRCTVQTGCAIYLEVGVLNRNIAGSTRLVSYGTGPPGYIGWAYLAWQPTYVAWRAGTKTANLAQPCLKLRLRIYLWAYIQRRDCILAWRVTLSVHGADPIPEVKLLISTFLR